jgi:hypothetical protein
MEAARRELRCRRGREQLGGALDDVDEDGPALGDFFLLLDRVRHAELGIEVMDDALGIGVSSHQPRPLSRRSRVRVPLWVSAIVGDQGALPLAAQTDGSIFGALRPEMEEWSAQQATRGRSRRRTDRR